MRIPLLRKVVAAPNMIPDRISKKSPEAEVRPLLLPKLFTKFKQPANERKAHELSAYGPDRNRPAGEIMCNAAAVKAILPDARPNTANVSLKSTITEKR